MLAIPKNSSDVRKDNQNQQQITNIDVATLKVASLRAVTMLTEAEMLSRFSNHHLNRVRCSSGSLLLSSLSKGADQHNQNSGFQKL